MNYDNLSDDDRDIIQFIILRTGLLIRNGSPECCTISEEHLDICTDNEAIIRIQGWRNIDITSGQVYYNMVLMKPGYNTPDKPVEFI